jgi:hypothetical protein
MSTPETEMIKSLLVVARSYEARHDKTQGGRITKPATRLLIVKAEKLLWRNNVCPNCFHCPDE